MNADEFVTKLGEIATAVGSEDNNPQDRHAANAARHPWETIPKRKTALFTHPPDVILDLLARYDLAGVTFWQFKFDEKPGFFILGPDLPPVWNFAVKPTLDYFVQAGEVLAMDPKAAYPTTTNLTSEQFLEVLAIFAEMTLRTAKKKTLAESKPMLTEYAARAAAIHPAAKQLGWFYEDRDL